MEKHAFHIPSLDGIRTVAFLIVFLSHAGLERIVPGGFGVTIFFFLSGYLITTLLRREHAKCGRISLLNFYQRRMIRIWPAFYVILGLGTVATFAGWLPGIIRPAPLAAQALHLANYYMIFAGNEGMPAGTGVYWSLAVEEHFYLVFPLLYVLLLRGRFKPRTQAAVLIGGCAVVLAWRCLLIAVFHAGEHRTFYATDTRFDSILFGCVLAVFGNPVLDPPVGSDRLWKSVLLPAGLAVLAFGLVFRDAFFRESFRYTLQGLALTPLFVVAIRHPRWGPFAFLNLGWVTYLGVLTYPLYLVHYMMLVAIRLHLPGWQPVAQGVAAFMGSLALAMLVHHGIEKPVARLRARRALPAAG